MKALDRVEAKEAGAEPVGRADVAVLPPSNAAAAKKGGWQAAGGVASAALTILVMLWFDPTVGGVIAGVFAKHPEWAIVFAALSVIFGFIRNRVAHRDPDSRLAIVGDPKLGSPADRRR